MKGYVCDTAGNVLKLEFHMKLNSYSLITFTLSRLGHVASEN
jgi:hypothetical protein